MQLTTNYTSQVIPVLPLPGGMIPYVAFVVTKACLAGLLYVIWKPPGPLFGRMSAGASSLEPSATG